MFCPNCNQDVEVDKNIHIDCDYCIGTGIGYPPPDTKCGHCLGRGYTIVEPYYTCAECGEYLGDVYEVKS